MFNENKTLNLNKFTTGMFFFIFVFSIYNRTFSILGDIRYIVIVFMLINAFSMVLERIKKSFWKVHSYFFFFLVLFIFILILDKISWLLSGLPKNDDVYQDVIILYSYHFLASLVIIINKNALSKKIIFNSVIFSSLFLSFSCFYQVFIGVLPFVSDNASGEAFKDSLSILGVRPAGYAHDPNYTSLLMVFTLYILFQKGRSFLTYLFFSLSIATLLVSGSKTVLLILIVLIIRYIFARLKWTLFFNIFSIVFCLFGLAAIFSLFEQLSTFSQRLVMWKIALEQFITTPFLGAGITGVRSALSLEMRYVQPHNGWLALLVDHGVILGGVIIGAIFYMALTMKDRATRYLLTVYIFLSFTNEMWVYPYWILFFIIAPIIIIRPNIQEAKYAAKD
ncbi:O-antigen ligase family protein [Pseudoalteromonas lipolytica]|jgi:O-antigen ligase